MSIRVLVVDDSLVFRTKMQLSLNSEPMFTVIGTAVSSADAYLKLEQLNPDVMTLDIEMPGGINGIEFLKQLLPKRSIPTIVVSSRPDSALSALNAGAIDFVSKPDASKTNSLEAFLKELKAKIRIASTAKVHRTPVLSNSIKLPQLRGLISNDCIIAIGASTGGTEAVIEVVKDLPIATPGIVIVQHMPKVFTNLYANRLNSICKMHVKEAENNDRVIKGQIIIAAGEYHLVLKKDSKGYYVSSKMGSKVSGHCPSVDTLFDSVAEIAGKQAIGVILTGMGGDGAKGMLNMRNKGSYTIGQDQDSCVVYGMPMEANKIGGVCKQVPLNKISDELVNHLNGTK